MAPGSAMARRLRVAHTHLVAARHCSELAGNPLMANRSMPAFRAISAEHVEPAIKALLAEQERAIEAMERRVDHLGDSVAYADVLQPLEQLLHPLSYAFGLVGHLMAVANSDELRAAHAAVQPAVVASSSRVAQSVPLYRAMKAIAGSSEELDSGQMRAVESAIRDAELGGVALEGAQKERFNQIKQRLAELSTSFSNNVLDATAEWSMTITDPEELDGMPPSALALAAQNAGDGATAEEGPYKLTLDMPMLMPVMTFASSRSLRETVYKANLTKASELSGNGEHNNMPLIEEILQLRAEMAGLLGFDSYASVSTAEKMAQSAEAVTQMTEDLRAKALPAAALELEALRSFAANAQGLPVESVELANWDVAYWSEKQREAQFAITDEETKPFLPLPSVLKGLFDLAETLFGVVIKPVPEGSLETWHDDVQCFQVESVEGEKLSTFYLDPYARPGEKRGGAWMNSALPRSAVLAPNGEERMLPVCYLVCNQTPPVGDAPSLMTYSDVETLFHEFGHGLQWMLTQTDNGLVAGINNVEWDAVELPSQFMENWLYSTYEVVQSLSQHIETSEPLPREIWQKIVDARVYMAGTAMLRQLFFGMADMALHARPSTHPLPTRDDEVMATFRDIASEYTVLSPLDEDRFLCSFGHIFAGGYAAGYYSYKWAEVLSADAFAAFEEAGLLEHGVEHVVPVGERFRSTVLGLGGSLHPMEVFKAFRGREPSVDALLRHNGLAELEVEATATA